MQRTYCKTETLDPSKFKGQKHLVVQVVASSADSIGLEKIVEKVVATGQYKINDWAMAKFGFRGSVLYHLRELKKLGMVVEISEPAKPAVSAGILTDTQPQSGNGSMKIPVPTKVPDGCVQDMARRFFGYGRWDAPYWFLGPEPGMPEKYDSLKARCDAWKALGGSEVVDCKAHHFGFGFHDWHHENPPPPLQPTWKQLIRFFLAFRDGNAPTVEEIRSYQQKTWGMRDGETCVIELSGVAAPKLKSPKTNNLFFDERIKVVRERMLRHKPALIVMYGLQHTRYWERVAGRPFPADNVLTVGPTVLVIARHPVSYGSTIACWLALADKLRQRVGSSFLNPEVTGEMLFRGGTDVPTITAPWSIIAGFALTFDGYEALGQKECGQFANKVHREFKMNPIYLQQLSITEARACLFFEQRRFNHYGWEPRGAERDYINALLDTIRSKLGG